MSNQIIRVTPFQAAKVSAVLYFIFGAIFAIPLALVQIFLTLQGGQAVGPAWVFIIMMPFMYAILAFIFVPLVCWIYNLAASWVGGFEITLQ